MSDVGQAGLQEQDITVGSGANTVTFKLGTNMPSGLMLFTPLLVWRFTVWCF